MTRTPTDQVLAAKADDLRELVEAREMEYHALVEEREAKRAEVRELDVQAARLMKHIAALRDMLTEIGDADAAASIVSIAGGMCATVAPSKRHSLAGLPRTQAIEIILVEASRALHRSEIIAGLINRGFPTERPDDTSAALTYLKRNGRVENVSRGYWRRAERQPGQTA